MVDMLDSKFNASNSVRVQVSLSLKNVAEMVKALDCKSNPAKVMGSSPIVHSDSPVSLEVKCPPFKRCVTGSIPVLGSL